MGVNPENGLPQSVEIVSRAIQPSGDTTGAMDAANINAVLSTGGHYVLGPGDFYVNAQLVINANDVVLRGFGTATRVHIASGVNANIIRVNPTGDGTGATRLARIAIESIYFDHSNTTADPSTGLAGCVTAFAVDHLKVRDCYVYNAASVGLQLQDCNDVQVLGNTVDTIRSFSAGNGINVVGSANITAAYGDIIVSDNIILDHGGDGIDVVGSKGARVTVSGNVCKQVNNSTGSPWGIAVESNPTTPSSEIAIVGNSVVGVNAAGTIINQYGIRTGDSSASGGVTASRITITGNIVRGATAWGIYANENQVSVVGNQVYDVSGGITTGSPNGTAAQTDAVIADNVINGGAGAIVGRSGVTVSKPSTGTLTNVTITGNIINCNNVLANGILVQSNVTDFLITSNRVDQARNQGILVNTSTQSPARGVVSSNNVTNSGLGAGNPYGIAVVGAVDTIKIVGNISRNRSGTSQTYGIFLDPLATNVYCAENDLRSNQTGPVNATPSTTNNQVFRGNQGYNPRGGSVTQPAVPASATAQTNGTGADCMVLVTGGTVTQIAIGATNTGQISGWFRVPAGQTITLTYSVAPTWTWFGD